MIKEFLINSGRFIFLVCLQLFILNNVQFSGFVNPYLYVLFILALPFETPGWILLTSSFVIGLTIDIGSVTIGYHTIACVFMAYLRYHLLRFIAPHDGYETGMTPTVQSLGLTWFFKYSTILVVVHHILLFWTEVAFRMADLPYATLRALASAVFTLLLIFVYEFLTLKRR